MTGDHGYLHSDLIHHPFGISLVRHTLTPGNSIPGALIMPVTGVVTAHNLLLFLHTFLTGFFTFLLLRSLKAGTGPSLVAGMIAMLWPARTAHAMTHLNIAGTAWIPLTLLLLLKVRTSRHPVWFISAVLSLTFLGLTAWHHLAAVLCIVWVVFPAPLDRERIMSGIRMAGAIILGICFLLPFIMPLTSPDPLIPERSSVEQAGFSIKPLSFLVPSFHHPVWDETVASYYENLPGNPIESTGYIGMAILMFLGFSGFKKRRFPLKWVIASLFLLLLSMGPELVIGQTRIPLPYKLLHLLPGFSTGRTPGRFLITTGITLAVVIGVILADWTARNSRDRLLTVVMGCLICLDFLPGSMPVSPAAISPAATFLANRPGSDGVLDVPAHWSVRRYMFDQIFHGKPIAGGFVSRIPVTVFDRENKFPLLKTLGDPENALMTLVQADSCDLSDLSDLLDIRYLMVHLDLLPVSAGKHIPGFKDRFGDSIVFQDGSTIIIDRTVWSEPMVRHDPAIYFYENWYPEEQWSGQPCPVRWAGDRAAEIRVFLPDGFGSVRGAFDIRSAPFPSGENQSVQVSWNGTQIHEIPVLPGTGWQSIVFEIPDPANRIENSLQFNFRCTARPSELHNTVSRDARPLAAAVKCMTLTSTGN